MKFGWANFKVGSSSNPDDWWSPSDSARPKAVLEVGAGCSRPLRIGDPGITPPGRDVQAMSLCKKTVECRRFGQISTIFASIEWKIFETIIAFLNNCINSIAVTLCCRRELLTYYFIMISYSKHKCTATEQSRRIVNNNGEKI